MNGRFPSVRHAAACCLDERFLKQVGPTHDDLAGHQETSLLLLGYGARQASCYLRCYYSDLIEGDMVAEREYSADDPGNVIDVLTSLCFGMGEEAAPGAFVSAYAYSTSSTSLRT